MAQAKAPKIVILYYSLWGHIRTMAKEVAEGVKESGCDVEIYQVPETLSADVVKAMHGVPQESVAKEHPILTRDKMEEVLVGADGLLFGCGTRFGMIAAQMKAFLDGTGGLWAKGALIGKPAGIFFSTGTPGGGQETTALTFVTQLTHHGMMFVPIGYGNQDVKNLEEVHGGSPYGAGTFAGPSGARQPSKLELGLAKYQGKYTGDVVKKIAGK